MNALRHDFVPMPADLIEAQVDEMDRLCREMTADREQVVAGLTRAFRDTDYDRLLAAAMKEIA